MPRTTKNKALLGEKFNKSLSEDMHCKPFTSSGFLSCDCCSKFGCSMKIVKKYFKKLTKDYWSKKSAPPLAEAFPLLVVAAVGKQDKRQKNAAKAVAPPTIMAAVGKKGKQQKKGAQVATPPTVMAVGKQGRQTKNSAKAVAPPLVVADVEKKGKQQKKPVQVSSPIMAAVGKQGRQTKNSAIAVAPPFGAGFAKKGKQQKKPGSTKAKASGARAKLERLPNKMESQADQSKAEGSNLAMFLAKYCVFLSEKKPLYEFPVIPEGKKTIRLCLPTTVRIFGLPTSTFQIVQALHTKDKKKIGLSMLKYFTQKFTGKTKMLAFYQTFRLWFPQEVVPVTQSFSQAVNLIETALLGKIMLLDENAQAAVKYIFPTIFLD